jgi:hypothetical protein
MSIAKYNPKKIDAQETILAATSLSKSTIELEGDLANFSTQTELARKARETFGQFLREPTSEQKAILAAAKEELTKLRRETTELRRLIIDFDLRQETYQSLSKELAQTNAELSKATQILEGHQFTEILQQLSDGHK